MIIVEGPDGSGKTRLIERLSRDLGLPVEPRVVSKDAQALTNLRKWVEKDLAGWPRSALYDRHRLISEPIYAPILRPSPEDGFTQHDWLCRQLTKLRAKKPTIIFCLPPLIEVQGNIDGDPGNEVVWEHITKIYWLYRMEAARWPEAYVWDYTELDADFYYKAMLNQLRRSENLASMGQHR